MNNASGDNNLGYQSAKSPLGGSYTERKLQKLGLPTLTAKRFLDLGCNAGFYCNYALTQGATRVVGVDVDQKLISSARRNYPDIEFYDQGWGRFPDGVFDVVIVLSAIHYADDPVALVTSIHEHLAPGGLLVLEGGLLDVDRLWKTDCLIPGWRQVGDRCRHLSSAYVRNHLLPSFEWDILGSSEPRGGDEVPRHVIHARKAARQTRLGYHSIDVVEYATGLAFSSRTIVADQPAFKYVSGLSTKSPVNRSVVEALLGSAVTLEQFSDDLVFALQPSQRLPVALYPVLSPQTMSALTQRLRTRGVNVVSPR